MSKLSMIDLYLQQSLKNEYVNTEKEQELLNKFSNLYFSAKAEQDKNRFASSENLKLWRKSYEGTLGALEKDGKTESKKTSRQLRKMVFELVESKVDNTVPMPKITPRYKSDLPIVNVTEHYLKYEIDNALSKFNNDRSERSTYVDGTSWYKVWWDSLDNTHERSGNVRVDVRTVDQIVPQPGVVDYKQLEYIFEIQEVPVSKIYKLYNRVISASGETPGSVKVISCYYLNDDGIVGLFTWCPESGQVICNEENWQIRKLRTCKICSTINPTGKICRVCGSDKLQYENATSEYLEEDLYSIYNPYDAGETDDESKKDEYQSKIFLTKGTEIPYYQIRQLPFVPRPAVSSMDSIYGISEVKMNYDLQDIINKLLTKSADKTFKSGAVLTKPKKLKIEDTDDTIKIVDLDTAEQAQQVQCKLIQADTNQDIVLAQLIYESARSSSGVTDSFQGKKDTTATSGKAKEIQALRTAGRIESLRVMKSAAFAGVYELVLKYLLAFSDEERRFINVLPDGKNKEECWNKYMFLDKDEYGQIYYRDDFTFSTDAASTLSQNRVQMWQETQDKFINGAFGVPSDPRTLKLFWNIMDSLQYPLSKVALAGIEESEQHLPPDIEQAIMQNPDILQNVAMMLKDKESGSGGAREGAGRPSNGFTHDANVERTNEVNRSKNRDVPVTGQL